MGAALFMIGFGFAGTLLATGVAINCGQYMWEGCSELFSLGATSEVPEVPVPVPALGLSPEAIEVARAFDAQAAQVAAQTAAVEATTT